ncbi:MAG: hypothetical protein RMI30_05125 [Thermodesulfovibrio sp.]|nr:hypothetical protein [Thermodesulfovibrio sp.]MDW7998819.1 hypothetical protein [Thermodesulfovibrio sp.]
MRGAIKFQCILDCSNVCCGGATIITLKELGKLYRFFPITLGFSKIYPLNSIHRKYIEDFSFRYKSFYIIGDFIAGNRLNKKCRLLKNYLCSIHGSLKPLQCHIIPFSVTFPEALQNFVIAERRRTAFKECKGFNESSPVIWNGEFTDEKLREKFYILRNNLIEQRDMMNRFFLKFENHIAFRKFIDKESGFLEVPIVEDFIDELCEIALIDDIGDFLKSQRSLFIKELTVGGIKNSLFVDALNAIDRFKSLISKI